MIKIKDIDRRVKPLTTNNKINIISNVISFNFAPDNREDETIIEEEMAPLEIEPNY